MSLPPAGPHGSLGRPPSPPARPAPGPRSTRWSAISITGLCSTTGTVLPLSAKSTAADHSFSGYRADAVRRSVHRTTVQSRLSVMSPDMSYRGPCCCASPSTVPVRCLGRGEGTQTDLDSPGLQGLTQARRQRLPPTVRPGRRFTRGDVCYLHRTPPLAMSTVPLDLLDERAPASSVGSLASRQVW